MAQNELSPRQHRIKAQDDLEDRCRLFCGHRRRLSSRKYPIPVQFVSGSNRIYSDTDDRGIVTVFAGIPKLMELGWA